jgi:hypothetical protein
MSIGKSAFILISKPHTQAQLLRDFSGLEIQRPIGRFFLAPAEGLWPLLPLWRTCGPLTPTLPLLPLVNTALFKNLALENFAKTKFLPLA